MKKSILAIIILALAIGAGWYVFTTMRDGGANTDAGAATQETAAVVAKVNGEEISGSTLEIAVEQIAAAQGVDTSSLDASSKAALRSVALDTLIGQVLIQQAVTKAGVQAPQEDVDAQLSSIRSQFDTEEAFLAALAENGTTLGDVTAQISTELSTQLFLSETLRMSEIAAATDEEIAAEYEKAIVGVETPPTLEESRAQVEAFILQQKQQARLNEYVQQLRSEATIEIL
jgi:peptidyl-prolyl cis-trans isomerase SurA